jgi:hypothetical protein
MTSIGPARPLVICTEWVGAGLDAGIDGKEALVLEPIDIWLSNSAILLFKDSNSNGEVELGVIGRDSAGTVRIFTGDEFQSGSGAVEVTGSRG